MRRTDALADEALHVRHEAAMEVVWDLRGVEERYGLLADVLAPSPALRAASEQKARLRLQEREAAREVRPRADGQLTIYEAAMQAAA